MRLQRGLTHREVSGAGWGCRCRCQCRNGLIRRREASEGHRYGLIHPRGSEGHRKDLGVHHHRGWEAPGQDEEGLDKDPREGVAQGQDQEGLDRQDGLARGGWEAPRHRAMLAGVQVGMEGTGGRERRWG